MHLTLSVLYTLTVALDTMKGVLGQHLPNAYEVVPGTGVQVRGGGAVQ